MVASDQAVACHGQQVLVKVARVAAGNSQLALWSLQGRSLMHRLPDGIFRRLHTAETPTNTGL